MTRRLTVTWPDRRPFEDRDGRPLRLLAISDEPDKALDHSRNRAALGPIDLVIGCGDLSPDALCFFGDAFAAPLVYVRGNHDRGGPWPHPRQLPVPSAGSDHRSLPDLELLALPWPTDLRGPARHDERAAWRQVITIAGARLIKSETPCLVFSHVPPRDVGDTPDDPYHRGFAAYRFLLERLPVPLWLHGHTALATKLGWHEQHGSTTVVNVTGGVCIDLQPAG